MNFDFYGKAKILQLPIFSNFTLEFLSQKYLFLFIFKTIGYDFIILFNLLYLFVEPTEKLCVVLYILAI